MRFLYLATILISSSGVVVAAHRLRLNLMPRPLARAVAITVPLFLAFDALGAARGWFRSSTSLNIAIFPPGVSIEEPLLLAFLFLLSAVLWRTAGRLA